MPEFKALHVLDFQSRHLWQLLKEPPGHHSGACHGQQCPQYDLDASIRPCESHAHASTLQPIEIKPSSSAHSGILAILSAPLCILPKSESAIVRKEVSSLSLPPAASILNV